MFNYTYQIPLPTYNMRPWNEQIQYSISAFESVFGEGINWILYQ